MISCSMNHSGDIFQAERSASGTLNGRRPPLNAVLRTQGHDSSLGQPRALVFPKAIEIPGPNRTCQIIDEYLGWLMGLRRLSCSSVSHFAIYLSTSILKQARLSQLVIRSTAQEDYQMKIRADCLRVGA
jgi:hypothetical protein